MRIDQVLYDSRPTAIPQDVIDAFDLDEEDVEQGMNMINDWVNYTHFASEELELVAVTHESGPIWELHTRGAEDPSLGRVLGHVIPLGDWHHAFWHGMDGIYCGMFVQIEHAAHAIQLAHYG